MKSTERFSNRVDNYVKYRPHYPKEIISYLVTKNLLTDNSVVADIGSGTGILTQLFLENQNPVFAVEPNEAMRLKAEERFGKYDNFKSINATAEQTTLDDSSIDLIIAGQAFHWFDAEKTKVEFKRIIKQDGYVVLVWNERQKNSDFENDYEKLLLKYATDYKKVNHTNINIEDLQNFFHPYEMNVANFQNQQVFNFESLKRKVAFFIIYIC